MRCQALALASLLAALPGGAALADRHCSPAIDGYFAARQIALADPGACESDLAAMEAPLASAVEWAQICGCADLEGRLRALAERPGESCPARLEAILGADEEIRKSLERCYSP